MISEFPLFVFTTLAGIAAGTYVMAAAFPKDGNDEKRPWLLPLIMLALLGLGLLGCLGHLHHPERFLNALWNPLAGISQEAYLSILFGVMLLADLVLCIVKGRCPRPVRIIGAVFGLLLTCVMGYSYATMLGVAVWNVPSTIPLFVVGDLALGAAVWPLFKRDAYDSKPYMYASIAIEALFAIDLAAIAVHFAGLGLGVVPFIAAIVLAPVVHIGLCASGAARKAFWMPTVACACVVIGCVIARYAFYAAYVA